MGHQVDLGKAGGRDLPVLGPDRDVVLEEGAGLRAPVEAAAELPFPLAEVPIDRPGADGLQGTLQLRREGPVLLGPGQPEGEEGLEPDGPGVASGLPDLRQDRQELGALGRRAAAAARPPRRRWEVGQDANRGFAVVPKGGAELGEDPRLGRAGCLTVALLDRLDVFAFGPGAHRGPPAARERGLAGNRIIDATMGSSVAV